PMREPTRREEIRARHGGDSTKKMDHPHARVMTVGVDRLRYRDGIDHLGPLPSHSLSLVLAGDDTEFLQAHAVLGSSSPAAAHSASVWAPGGPAARPSSRRSSLEMVHWTISSAFGGPFLTHPLGP